MNNTPTIKKIARYPDSLRQQAIALYQQGKGYKAIGRELGLTRDTVRNWISIYRITGRTENVQTTGQMGDVIPYSNEEERLIAARKEYETTSVSLKDIVRKYSLNYSYFRQYLLQNYPESALLHTYASHIASFQKALSNQRESLDRLEQEYIERLKKSLDKEMLRYSGVAQNKRRE